MRSLNLIVGNVVKLKKRFLDAGHTALIVKIEKAEMPGDGGWISMQYTVLGSSGNIIYISEDCIDYVIE